MKKIITAFAFMITVGLVNAQTDSSRSNTINNSNANSVPSMNIILMPMCIIMMLQKYIGTMILPVTNGRASTNYLRVIQLMTIVRKILFTIMAEMFGKQTLTMLKCMAT